MFGGLLNKTRCLFGVRGEGVYLAPACKVFIWRPPSAIYLVLLYMLHMQHMVYKLYMLYMPFMIKIHTCAIYASRGVYSEESEEWQGVGLC